MYDGQLILLGLAIATLIAGYLAVRHMSKDIDE